MIRNIGLPKFLLASFVILSMALAFVFSPYTNKAHAATPNLGAEVAKTAKRYMGSPYKWAGTTPKGFDASGYTQYVFKASPAKMNLPRTSKLQYKLGKSVKQKDLKQGDLVFFKTNGKEISFVGIYLEKNQFIAVTVSKGVSIQSLSTKYWKDSFVGAKRVLK